jgi:hypothetical protein
MTTLPNQSHTHVHMHLCPYQIHMMLLAPLWTSMPCASRLGTLEALPRGISIVELSGIQPLALNALPCMAATADAAAMQWYQHECSAYVKVEPICYSSGPSVNSTEAIRTPAMKLILLLGEKAAGLGGFTRDSFAADTLGELGTLGSMLALDAAFKDRLSMPTHMPAVQYAHCLRCPFNFFCHACDNLLSNAVLLRGSRCCMCLKVSTICIHSPPPCSSDSEPFFLPSFLPCPFPLPSATVDAGALQTGGSEIFSRLHLHSVPSRTFVSLTASSHASPTHTHSPHHILHQPLTYKPPPILEEQPEESQQAQQEE